MSDMYAAARLISTSLKLAPRASIKLRVAAVICVTLWSLLLPLRSCARVCSCGHLCAEIRNGRLVLPVVRPETNVADIDVIQIFAGIRFRVFGEIKMQD